MSFELPLVFFTLLSQLAVGLAFFETCHNLKNGTSSSGKIWTWIFIFMAAGLISSLFHLGHPFHAYKALTSLGLSWLSREVLLMGIFCGLALINIFLKSRFLGVLTTLCGIGGIIAQGITYAPPSMPAIHNLFPVILFLLTALAFGACSWSVLQAREITLTSRAASLVLAAIILLAPVFWFSGTATMQASAHLWASSALFWFGAFLLLVAFGGSYWKDFSPATQLCALTCGLILTRMIFFAGIVHTASNLGFPYS